MRSLLSLVMIVKDEAANIKDVLASVKPHIDRFTIWDTGSTDGTQDVVRAAMEGKPGLLHEEPFIGCSFKDASHLNHIIDFAATRNRALDLDRFDPCVFQLVMSADEYLRDGDKLREYLERERDSKTDCYHVRLLASGDQLYPQRVFRTGSDWRFEHAIHEVPYNRVDPSAPTAIVPGASIEHIPSDDERRIEAVHEKHIPVLQAMLAEDPKSEHALRYLAQSLETLLPFCEPGDRITHAMEGMSYYLRRFQAPDLSDAERNYLKYKYLHLSRFAGVYSPAEVLSRVQEICEADPHRPEPALLRVYAAVAAGVPTVQVHGLAVEAARVARDWSRVGNASPVPTSCEWKAHHAAAQAAKRLAERAAKAAAETTEADAPDPRVYADLVRQHVADGVAAGGPWEMFKSIVPPAAAETLQ
jgi:glycosyltransferase involved in cell wall biosynthesis